MSPDTATRLFDLDILARQISSQISGARAAPDELRPEDWCAQPGARRPRVADDYNVALRQGLAEIENLLRARTEELEGERLRSREDRRRAEALLAETRTRLAVAEQRAEEAEGYLGALHELIRANLDVAKLGGQR